jgi:vitamin B12 transporter
VFKFLVFIFLPFLSSYAQRLDPIIVTSKTHAKSSELTSSHNVITKQQMQTEVMSNVIEALRSLPGIYINQTGGPGSQASIFIRGSEVRHVLVLIDGVKVNDPSNPDKQFNAANLSLIDIEKIEVIKGAQSVLYGSDAIGGVINIITKKGEPRQQVGVEYGLQQQVHGAITRVGHNSVTYLNLLQAQSEGISAKYGGLEKDGFEKKGLTLNHSQSFGKLEIDWMAKLQQDFVEDDGMDSSFNFVDDENAYSKSLQQLYKQGLSYQTDKMIFKHNLSLNKTDRLVKYFDTDKSAYLQVNYAGSTLAQDLMASFDSLGTQTVMGLSHEYETFKKDGLEAHKFNLYSAYAAVNQEVDRTFWNIGLRGDYHEQFKSIATYNLGVGYNFENRRQLKLNHATGFKSPSIYQLYIPYDGPYKVGNPDLRPEKSRTFDLTYLQRGLFSYELTLFNNYIYDYFYYDSSGYSNQGSFNSQGIEISARQKFEHGLEIKEGVTLAKFDLSSGKKVLRRPEQKIDLGIDYKMNEQVLFSLDWRWISARFDSQAGKEKVLPAYDLVNFVTKYHWGSHDLQVGVNNLFDRKYFEVYDYSTLGMTVFMRANFNY